MGLVSTMVGIMTLAGWVSFITGLVLVFSGLYLGRVPDDDPNPIIRNNHITVIDDKNRVVFGVYGMGATVHLPPLPNGGTVVIQ